MKLTRGGSDPLTSAAFFSVQICRPLGHRAARQRDGDVHGQRHRDAPHVHRVWRNDGQFYFLGDGQTQLY